MYMCLRPPHGSSCSADGSSGQPRWTCERLDTMTTITITINMITLVLNLLYTFILVLYTFTLVLNIYSSIKFTIYIYSSIKFTLVSNFL